MTGKLTTLSSSTTSAGLSIGVSSAAPTGPLSGDLYGTTAGLYYNAGSGGIKGPFGTLASLATNSPIAGGTITGTSGTISCPTCATTTNGGALSATGPIAISPAGVISIGNIDAAPVMVMPGAITAGSFSWSLKWPWATGTIASFSYATGGTGTPSFTAGISINGTVVTGCTGLTVTSSATTTATCSAANAVVSGQPVVLNLSSVSGSPTGATFQLNYSHSLP